MLGVAVLTSVLVMAMLGVGCTDSSESKKPPGTSAPTEYLAAKGDGPTGRGRCDPTDASACLLPWPNDNFTRPDPKSPTGRRVDLPADGMPANASGTRVDPTEWNRNDGFSPASRMLTVVEGVDPAVSKLPPITDIGASLRPDSPLVVVDLTTGKRIAAWAELDANTTDPSRQALAVVPAADLPEGHRIAVGLSGLVKADGSKIEAGAAFGRLRKRPTADQRRWLGALAANGAPTDRLVIAWAFTVASTDGQSGRLRHMWSETADELGDGAPAFRVSETREQGAARIVEGDYDMPRYLTGDGGPGSVLDNADDPNGLPKRNGTMTADFLCVLPKAASAEKPAKMIVYGHGLLGSRSEVLDIGSLAATVGVGMCATDWLGMSRADVPTVLDEFKDLSRFRTQPDRMLQGQLAFLLLGRLIRSAAGFVTNPAFQDATGAAALARDQLAFLGASQGGILGGAASAVGDEWQHVVLAVGALGYNLLLPRSVDFDEFAGPFEASYPDELDRNLLLDLMEQLWDRGENAGYAAHLAKDPYPGVTAKSVLILEAFGDHQVANVATQRLARTVGTKLRTPALAPGRSPDVEPFWGIPPVASFPTHDSTLVVWDSDPPPPPLTNTPNRAGDDPHGKLAHVPAALGLLVGFLDGGTIADVCGGAPCRPPAG